MPIESAGVLVIVGGGTVDASLLRELESGGAMIVAADGGADVCAECGIVPAAIIGDMDSVSDPGRWAGRTRVVAISEQLTTDFEKCLYSTRAPVTLAVGMTGQRLDHTLAALDALVRFASDRHIVMVDECDIALAVTGAFSFAVDAGERVSVHPLGAIRFAASEGLQYPLDGLTLAPGVRTGTSNAAETGVFSVTPAEGQTAPWLLIVDKRHLGSLIAHLCGVVAG